MALGFAREHRSSDAYIQCVLCRSNIKVGSRGISTFLEHCRGVIHHRVDCLLRLRRGLGLRRRTGTLMDPDEVAHWEEELRGFSLFEIETCPAFSVQVVLVVEADGGNAGSQV